MLYLNQLLYPHVPYNHNLDAGGPPEGRTSIKTSGCGLCCACMIVDQLTDSSLSLEECIKLTEECGANRVLGSSMELLGAAVSDRFKLDFSVTNSIAKVISHLRRGGRAVAIVGGDREGYRGLFSTRRHYITLIAFDGKEFTILDPSLSDTKFEEKKRRDRVRVQFPFVYCSKEEIVLETQTEKTKYYLFARK